MKRQPHARIDWHDESTWTLDALSNWTAQRDLLSTSAVLPDASYAVVRQDYKAKHDEYIKDAPAWALAVTSRVLMVARMQRSLSSQFLMQWDEQGFINLVKAVYGDNNG